MADSNSHKPPKLTSKFTEVYDFPQELFKPHYMVPLTTTTNHHHENIIRTKSPSNTTNTNTTNVQNHLYNMMNVFD